MYNVVDGKQRLTTVFEFIQNQFPVSEKAQTTSLRGLYFEELDDEVKRSFWSYDFLVEYLPTTDESIINNVFDRINKNVAKLTRQELRHARFDGKFISATEQLADWMREKLPSGFPNIAPQSRKQMKDAELVAQLLLLLEEGVKTYTQDELDKAFSDKDAVWERHAEIESRFKDTVGQLYKIANDARYGEHLCRSRFRNQADFYSLFGAVAALQSLKNVTQIAQRLHEFINTVDDETARQSNADARDYYEAARSASNNATQRNTRIRIIGEVMVGGVPSTSTS